MEQIAHYNVNCSVDKKKKTIFDASKRPPNIINLH